MEALTFYEQHYHNAQPPGAHRGMGYPPMGYQPGYPPPAANPQAAWLGLGLGLDLTLTLTLLTLTLTLTLTLALTLSAGRLPAGRLPERRRACVDPQRGAGGRGCRRRRDPQGRERYGQGGSC